jgi:hypothetical protein
VAQLHLFLHPEDRIPEVDAEVEAQIIALAGATAAALATAGGGATETTEEGLEQVGETTHVTHVGRTTTATEAGFTELVVAGAGLGIAEHLIGAADLLELILSPGFLVDVGVVLAGHAPIGPLEAVGIHIPGNAQQVVIVGHQPPCPSPEPSAGSAAPEGPGPMDTFTKAWRSTRPLRW